MDDRTEELREVFLELTDEETVTETQENERGSLAGADERDADERLAAVVERMRERYEFGTDLERGEYVEVVRGFYDDESDAEIAEAVGVDRGTVLRARADLHLLRESDPDLPVDPSAVRNDDRDAAAVAADLGVDRTTVERARRVARAREKIIRTSRRFQSEFEDALPEAALSVRLTEGVHEDGLEEAAEDIETDVSF